MGTQSCAGAARLLVQCPALMASIDFFGESMLLKTFQYIVITAGFSACILFMLLLALTEPLI